MKQELTNSTIVNKKVYFKTFGCRTNIFDTQAMVAQLKNQDIEAYEVSCEGDSDIVVVNSCTVTNGADSDVRHYVNKMKKNGKTIFFTGCGSHTQGARLFSAGQVDGVFGQSLKQNVSAILSQKNFFDLGDLESVDSLDVGDFEGKTRAFLKIQEGCSFACSYCIIPAVRGKSRSYTDKNVIAQVQKLAQKGFSEFVFTGTNIGSYGQKQNSSLPKLLKKISQIKGIKRLRVGSIEPLHVTDEFLEILDEPWMEKHLHIAIQHSHDHMLKLMNRRNRVKADQKLFATLANKNIAIGTDYIVGHPGETETLWKEAIKALKDYHLTHVHAFIYSLREGTHSSVLQNDLGAIDGTKAKARLQNLQRLVQEKNRIFRQKNVQTSLKVLVESEKKGQFTGLDQFYNRLQIQSTDDLKGTWIDIKNYKVEHECNVVEL